MTACHLSSTLIHHCLTGLLISYNRILGSVYMRPRHIKQRPIYRRKVLSDRFEVVPLAGTNPTGGEKIFVIFVKASCEHTGNFDFHSGLTSSPSHVNGTVASQMQIIAFH